VSIPFTWDLPIVAAMLRQRDAFWDRAVVGGPALDLMPGYFGDIEHVEEGKSYPGVLQIVNPQATRTSTGCCRACRFCGIGKGLIEPGGIHELAEWPALPAICDNNLLACSLDHFDKVMDSIHDAELEWVDFNQGLDARLLQGYHSAQFAELPNPLLRLALDCDQEREQWECAYDLLRSDGIAKNKIRSYVLVGYDSDPYTDWARCEFVESFGVKALPMFFRELDALSKEGVTKAQSALGWDDLERRRIMQWYYQHNKKYGLRADVERLLSNA
jgi:hypothetical protein